MMETLFRAVKSHAFFGPGLKFHPTSDALALEAAKLPKDIPRVTTDQLYEGISYQPLVLSTGVGRLRFETIAEIDEAAISYTDIVVVDSVAALVPQAEIDGDMGEPQMGLQARLMSQAMRKLTGIVHKTKTCVIFINQIRQKIGVFFGNPETTTGGNALKFYASVRLDIRRLDAIKSGQEVVGNRTRVKIVKNKVAPPFRQVEFDIMYGNGICRAGELLDLAVQREIVQKSGAWFAYSGERIGQGRDNARLYLEEHPETAVAIEAQVRQALSMPQAASETLAAAAAAASLNTDTDLFHSLPVDMDLETGEVD